MNVIDMIAKAAAALYVKRGGPWVKEMAPLNTYERSVALRIVSERLTYEAGAYRFDPFSNGR